MCLLWEVCKTSTMTPEGSEALITGARLEPAMSCAELRATSLWSLFTSRVSV